MADIEEHNAAQRARVAVRELGTAFLRLRRHRGAVTGIEALAMEEMAAAIRRANEALGIDIAANVPGPTEAEERAAHEQADEMSREASWN